MTISFFEGGYLNRGRISRLGNVILREQEHRWPRAVSSGLATLHDRGYRRCPMVVCQPTECSVAMTYIPGTTLSSPVAAWASEERTVRSVSRFLCEFSRAADGIGHEIQHHDWLVPPPPGEPQHVFVHGDPHPTNVVFDEAHNPCGLIDFELATLGSHAWNLASLVYSWAPLEPPELTCWRNATDISVPLRTKWIAEEWDGFVDSETLGNVMPQYIDWRQAMFCALARSGNPSARAFVQNPMFQSRHRHALEAFQCASAAWRRTPEQPRRKGPDHTLKRNSTTSPSCMM